MSIVDPLSRTMVIDCTRIISFDKEDVARVFGIPCGGNLVSQLSMTQDEVISKVMDGYLGSQLRDYRSIKSVQEVVERDYGSTMTIEEENAFKGAFVIYVVSMILSPGTKYDHTSFDYWDALVDPSAIHTFDWCDYVICRLFDAVVKVKSDIRGNCKAACITGCSLFLQVLYLDSIDIGVLKLQHNSFPRVRHFGQTTMNSMILADTLTDFDDMTGCLFGKSKFRPHGEVCYYWASNPRRHVLSQLNQTPCTLWESARLFAEDLLLPAEVSAPFFFFALIDSFNHTKNMRPDAGLKMMSVMVMIISYYRQGFRYSTGAEDLKSCIFDVCCQQCISMGDQLNIVKKKHASTHYCQCRSASGSTPCFSVSEACNSLFMFFRGSVMRFVEESPLGLVKHCMAARAMARFYMSVRPRKHESGIDLNRSTIKYEGESFFSTRRAMSIVPAAKTPWELGVNAVFHLDDMDCAEAILEKIGEGSNEKRKCIVHYEPKYIEVCLASIKLCINGVCEMESDIFDAALRRFKQIDDEAYSAGKYARWRHFFESDFLGSIIAGCFDINDPSIRAQVVGDHLEYDIANCRMLYFPGIVEQRWVCYAWCLQLNSIMVFDPCALKCPPNGVVMVHKHVAASIKAVMDEVGNKISARVWDHDWKAGSVTMLKMAVAPDQCFVSASMEALMTLQTTLTHQEMHSLY